jgi:hypothetical protein
MKKKIIVRKSSFRKWLLAKEGSKVIFNSETYPLSCKCPIAVWLKDFYKLDYIQVASTYCRVEYSEFTKPLPKWAKLFINTTDNIIAALPNGNLTAEKCLEILDSI